MMGCEPPPHPSLGSTPGPDMGTLHIGSWSTKQGLSLIAVPSRSDCQYEVEVGLLSHFAVEGAVVYSVAEGRFGEVPHAKVKLRAGETGAERENVRFVNEKVSLFRSLRGVDCVAGIPKKVTGEPRRLD